MQSVPSFYFRKILIMVTKKMLTKNDKNVIRKTLTGLLVGVFLFNNVFAWAQEERLFSATTENMTLSSYQVKHKLSPKLRLTQGRFREDFEKGYLLLAHDAINDYINQKIEEINGFENLRQREDTIEGKIDMLVVAIPGLFANRGQFAHVGLGKHNDKPVIYIDENFYYDEGKLGEAKNKIIGHDTNEILNWSGLATELEIPLSNLREKWIYGNPEATKKASAFHDESNRFNNINPLYAEYTYMLNWNEIYRAYETYGLDKEDEIDVNIAAHKAESKKTGGKKKKASKPPKVVTLSRKQYNRAIGEYHRFRFSNKFKEADLLTRIILADAALEYLNLKGTINNADRLLFHLDTSLKENSLLDEVRKQIPVLVDHIRAGKIKSTRDIYGAIGSCKLGDYSSGGGYILSIVLGFEFQVHKVNLADWLKSPGIIFPNKPEEMLWRDVYRVLRLGMSEGFFDCENCYDTSGIQLKVLRAGRSLKFSPGYLCHGRDGLDEVILKGRLEGRVHLCRVGHQYATNDFYDSESESPAIFIIKTELFEKLRQKRKAELKLVGGTMSMADPYPTIYVPVELDDITEVWVSEETYSRYQKILTSQDLSEKELAMKPVLERLMSEDKIKEIPGLNSKNADRFRDIYTVVGSYMESRGLLTNMPLFRTASRKMTIRENFDKRARLHMRRLLRNMAKQGVSMRDPVQIDAIYIDGDWRSGEWDKRFEISPRTIKDLAYLIKSGIIVHIVTAEDYATFEASNNNFIGALQAALDKLGPHDKSNIRVSSKDGGVTIYFDKNGNQKRIKKRIVFSESDKAIVCRHITAALLKQVKIKHPRTKLTEVTEQLQNATSLSEIVNILEIVLEKYVKSYSGDKGKLEITDEKIVVSLGEFWLEGKDILKEAKDAINRTAGKCDQLLFSSKLYGIEVGFYSKADIPDRWLGKDSHGGISVGIGRGERDHNFLQRIASSTKFMTLPIQTNPDFSISSSEGVFIHARGHFLNEIERTTTTLRKVKEEGLTYADLPFVANRWSLRQVAETYGFKSMAEFEAAVMDKETAEDVFGLLLDNPPVPLKSSPAVCLMTIRDNKIVLDVHDDSLLELALSKNRGITAKEVLKCRPYNPNTGKPYNLGTIKKELETLVDLGIFVPVKENPNHYIFSDMMIGPDLNYTRSLINAINDITYQIGKKEKPLHRYDIPKDKVLVVKELVKMTILHQVNLMLKPVVPEKKVLWHVIEESIVPVAQRSYFQEINNASKKSNAPERIWILRKGESIEQAISRIKEANPNESPIFDVALSSASHVRRIKDKKIKMLIFEGRTGDFRQIEGIIAALRTLYLPKEKVIPGLLQIYNIMGATPKKGNKSIEKLIKLLDNPQKFALSFVYVLPPMTSMPINDIPKINRHLLKLLIAA